MSNKKIIRPLRDCPFCGKKMRKLKDESWVRYDAKTACSVLCAARLRIDIQRKALEAPKRLDAAMRGWELTKPEAYDYGQYPG